MSARIDKAGLYLDPTGYSKPQPIASVLRRQASQENCDGEPYDAMMFAANHIDRLTAALSAAPHPDETLAWAVVAGDGQIKHVTGNGRNLARQWAEAGDSIERVAIRRVEDKE